jgi:TRAP-type uncharacterized transport system substrate-binding protein
MATGNAPLFYEVASGAVDVGFINPSGLLTQAYLGRGIFQQALPLRVVACYPSLDRAIFVTRRNATWFGEIVASHQPLRLSIRRDATHATVILLEQILACYGLSLALLEAQGVTFQYVRAPQDPERLGAIADGTIDAVFDEGTDLWLDEALGAGFIPLRLDDRVIETLQGLGWRRATVSTDWTGIDFSGWALYTRESMPKAVVYRMCDALHERARQIPWETNAYTDFGQLGRDSAATPLDVPLHPGAARWFSDHT